MRVLIADDCEIVVERLRTILAELEGIEVFGQARDAVEATKLILELQPDVVILDIRIPKGSGIEVLRNIRQSKHSPAVIALTAFPNPQYRKQCLDLGVKFFFNKATEFHKIIEVLKQITPAPEVIELKSRDAEREKRFVEAIPSPQKKMARSREASDDNIYLRT